MHNPNNFHSKIPLDSPARNLAGTSLTSREAAAFLAASVKTLDLWRREGRGPAFIRQGRSIRYRLADLIAFQESHKVEPERD